MIAAPPFTRLFLWLALTPLACGETRGPSPLPLPSAAASAPPVEPPTAAPVAAPEVASAPAIDGGVDAGPTAPPACPDGMARIGRFCIDRYEAHLATRTPDGAIVPWFHTARPSPDTRYEARSAPSAFPQAYISRVEAAAACKNAGKRLCSIAEWRRACEGRRGTTYPYGESWKANRCNTDKPHLLSIHFGSDARRWRYENFNEPTLDEEPGFLAKAGDYSACVSDAGVHDLVGNLHEWVSDTVDDALMEKLAAEDVERNDQPSRPGNGVFMGGFFSTHQELGPGCKFITVAHEPTYHDYSTGFRCCATAPQAAR
jgi:sulfatase modifying factor 1